MPYSCALTQRNEPTVGNARPDRKRKAVTRWGRCSVSHFFSMPGCLRNELEWVNIVKLDVN